jgi:hypothetical protein
MNTYFTAVKDAAIVATAIEAKTDNLISLDRRHLVGVPDVAQGSGSNIVLPEEFFGHASRKQRIPLTGFGIWGWPRSYSGEQELA